MPAAGRGRRQRPAGEARRRKNESQKKLREPARKGQPSAPTQERPLAGGLAPGSQSPGHRPSQQRASRARWGGGDNPPPRSRPPSAAGWQHRSHPAPANREAPQGRRPRCPGSGGGATSPPTIPPQPTASAQGPTPIEPVSEGRKMKKGEGPRLGPRSRGPKPGTRKSPPRPEGPAPARLGQIRTRRSPPGPTGPSAAERYRARLGRGPEGPTYNLSRGSARAAQAPPHPAERSATNGRTPTTGSE